MDKITLIKATYPEQDLRTWWHHEIGKDGLRRRMDVWSKKLNLLNDEMLYFVFYEASRIIERRDKENERSL